MSWVYIIISPIIVHLFMNLPPPVAWGKGCDEAFRCQNIGNILIGPKGLKRIFEEQINNPEFIEKLKTQFKENLKNLDKQTYYKTPEGCDTETVGDVANGFVISRTLKMSSKCLLFPKFDPDGTPGYNTKLVPFHSYANNFQLEDVDFEIEDPICDGDRCWSQIKIKTIKVSSSLIVEESHGGKILEHPDFLFSSHAKGTKIAASVNVIVNLDDNGRLDSAVGDFKNLNIDGESMTLTPIIRGADGKILSNGINANGDYREEDDEESQHIARVSREFRCDHFLTVFAQRDLNTAQKFYRSQSRALIRSRKSQGLWDSKTDGDNLNKAYQLLIAKMKQGDSISCKDKPQIFNYFPSFVEASHLGELSAQGYSGKISKQFFDGMVRVINEGTFANEEVIRKYTIPKIQSEVLEKAKGALADSIKKMAGEANVVLNQDIALPILDPGYGPRKAYLKEKIALLEERTKKPVPQNLGHQRATDRRRLKEYNEALQAIDKQNIATEDSVNLYTQYTMDKINDLNRIRLINGDATRCKAIKGLDPGIVSNKTLGDNEFVFELPITTVQTYIDEMFRRNPYICSGSYKKDCQGGSKLKMTNSPQIQCEKTGKCHVTFGKVEASKGTLLGDITSSFDFEMDLDITQCGQSICLNMDNPDVKNEGTLLWLKGVFRTSVQEEAQEAMDKIRSDNSIDIGPAIPDEIKKSFSFSQPIITENGIGIPMNLNDKTNRVIML